MNRPQNICRIEEVQGLQGVEGVWRSTFQRKFVVGLVKLVPMRPAKFETMRSIADVSVRQLTDVGDHGVKNPDDSPIEIGVCRTAGFGGIEQHNITLWCVDMDDVLFAPNIVRVIVDSHQFVAE